MTAANSGIDEVESRDALREARELIGEADRLVVFSGAGLSAESGLPTFRDGAGSGLWERYDPMRLASIEGFDADPGTVLAWYRMRRRALAAVEPNAAHRALAAAGARFSAAGRELWQVTQNVDDLLERAGVPADEIDHLHGRITLDRCHRRCGYERAVEPGALTADTGSTTSAAATDVCPRCGAVLRPAVVWFGEALPEAAWQRAVARLARADALLVVGTSASVWPAAGLVDDAIRRGLRPIVVDPDADNAHAARGLAIVGRATAALPSLFDPE